MKFEELQTGDPDTVAQMGPVVAPAGTWPVI